MNTEQVLLIYTRNFDYYNEWLISNCEQFILVLLVQAFFFTKFLEDLVGPTLLQAEFFVLSFEFFSYSEFFWAEDTK